MHLYTLPQIINRYHIVLKYRGQWEEVASRHCQGSCMQAPDSWGYVRSKRTGDWSQKKWRSVQKSKRENVNEKISCIYKSSLWNQYIFIVNTLSLYFWMSKLRPKISKSRKSWNLSMLYRKRGTCQSLCSRNNTIWSCSGHCTKKYSLQKWGKARDPVHL